MPNLKIKVEAFQGSSTNLSYTIGSSVLHNKQAVLKSQTRPKTVD